MINLFYVELRKLRGSLAISMLVLASSLPGVLIFLSAFIQKAASPWEVVLHDFLLAIWAFFLLPMTIMAFATLIAQVEYRSNAWDHLLALPISRVRVFYAKAAVLLAGLLFAAVVLVAASIIGAWLGGVMTGHRPVGDIPFAKLFSGLLLVIASSFWLSVIQLWVAFRYSSFVVPLAVGIGGTLVAIVIAITRVPSIWWFPWALPLGAVTSTDPTPQAWLGTGAALVTLVVMPFDLRRRLLR